jgi:hypothetical protein
MKAYAGIGARVIDPDTTIEFIKIGRQLAQMNFALRSGGTEGSDLAFEQGAKDSNGEMEIFLPWTEFNHNKSSLILPQIIPDAIVEIASTLYPRWYSANNAAQRLHARNVQQILGKNLDEESAFVVCYTDRSYTDPSAFGGTMFGIKLAERYNIPVYNFYLRGDRERFYDMLETYAI